MKITGGKKRGFTLIELIVVMVIIGILVGLATPKYLNYTKDAHVTALQQDAKVLQNVTLAYNVKNNGAVPVVTKDIVAADGVLAAKLLVDADIKTKADIAKTIMGASATDTVVAAAKYNVTTGVLEDAGAGVKIELAALDPNKVNTQLQNTKNPLSDYAIVVRGEGEGTIVNIAKTLKNSDGDSFVTVTKVAK